jgi:Zn-dependent M28 family amino/carboxypeptidase
MVSCAVSFCISLACEELSSTAARPPTRDRRGGLPGARIIPILKAKQPGSPLKRFFSVLAAATLLSSMTVAGDSPSPIDPARMSAIVKTLASDSFQGRAPGTPGEKATVAYLVDQFRSLGLQPAGENGGWLQSVPLVHNVAGAPRLLEIKFGAATLPLLVGRDINPQTARPVSRVTITDAPVVFVGYGVSAPERRWDDFKGVDLHGKVAIFLVNDPDFEAAPDEPVAGKFGGRAMTYYGRWTYKFEEAARRGAIAAFVIHETAAAGYGWNVASNSVGGTYDIARAAGQTEAVLLQAWLSREAAVGLLGKAGLDFDTLKRQARDQQFKPIELSGARFSIDMPVKTERVDSHNVLAKLPGTQHPDETLLFAAHWDAYGIGDPDSAGRTIRPGANDDGLGIAGVLELARAFARGPRTERTLVFAAWTAEERGLLGSETFGVHPLFPLAKMVANLTIDILQTAGPSRDVVLIGAGQNDLETDLARAAAAQGRTITADAKPERGLFYRADHFSLAKRGVPTLLLMGIGGGADLVNGGRPAGDAWVSDYTTHCYHQTCDAWNADWDLRGAAQDVDLFYRIGLELADSRRWPEWNATSEFKARRDASASQRAP